jgi:DAACS family dicarboxylate/amino acid:cation (Na+ or H+) symporter
MSEYARPPVPERSGLVARWRAIPLYVRIVAGLILGTATGVIFGAGAAPLIIPARLVLRLLGALAPALILFAVLRALISAELRGAMAARLVGLLSLNTLVAIGIGLLVANLLQPGATGNLHPLGAEASGAAPANPLMQLLENIPKSLLGPLGDDGKVIGVIFLAVAFGVALRRSKDRPLARVVDLIEIIFDALVTILLWVIDLVPIAVFCVVASIVGSKGFAAFASLGAFVGAVLLALVLQTAYYLTRVALLSWVSPRHLLRGGRDALVMAFSTASSTATMPVTYACLRDKVGLRDRSASMGALVGANFNNDGTALYEAMAALFVAQALGMDLDLSAQLMVVLMSVVASVGAAGIPEAGLVTMTMVFKAVALPTDYIAVLLTVDWFLDRCRTTINVMGDMNVSCLLDGREREQRAATTP